MKMKLIQVGLGAHGRGVAEHIVLPSPDFALAGLVDIAPDALQAFAGEHGLSEKMLFTDYRQAFREAKADAVMVEVASPAHFAICREALENGLHVLVEKPFALTMEEAEELVRIAALQDRRLMVNQNYRYFSSVLTLRRAMQERNLGQLLFIDAQFYCDHNGKPYQREMDNYILLEMAVHHVDMIRFLLGEDIGSVQGRCWNQQESGYKSAPHVTAVYETVSGITAVYTASLLAKGVPMPWEGVWRIQFAEGAIHMADMGQGYGVYIVRADGIPVKLPPVIPEKDSMHGTLAEFAQSIREVREPAISGRDNLNTLAALLATAQSSREGALVHIAPAGGSGDR